MTCPMHGDECQPPDCQEPLYFGCNKRPGHYAHIRNGNELWHVGVRSDQRTAAAARWLEAHEAVFPSGDMYSAEGKATVYLFERATVLAFWDRSVDHRANCSSTFLLGESMEGPLALAHLRTWFPSVFERFDFEVTLP